VHRHEGLCRCCRFHGGRRLLSGGLGRGAAPRVAVSAARLEGVFRRGRVGFVVRALAVAPLVAQHVSVRVHLDGAPLGFVVGVRTIIEDLAAVGEREVADAVDDGTVDKDAAALKGGAVDGAATRELGHAVGRAVAPFAGLVVAVVQRGGAPELLVVLSDAAPMLDATVP